MLVLKLGYCHTCPPEHIKGKLHTKLKFFFFLCEIQNELFSKGIFFHTMEDKKKRKESCNEVRVSLYSQINNNNNNKNRIPFWSNMCVCGFCLHCWNQTTSLWVKWLRKHESCFNEMQKCSRTRGRLLAECCWFQQQYIFFVSCVISYKRHNKQSEMCFKRDRKWEGWRWEQWVREWGQAWASGECSEMRLRWLPFSHISLPLVASLVTQTSLSAHEIRQSALFHVDLLSLSLGFEVQQFVVWTSSDQKQLHVIHPISVYMPTLNFFSLTFS